MHIGSNSSINSVGVDGKQLPDRRQHKVFQKLFRNHLNHKLHIIYICIYEYYIYVYMNIHIYISGENSQNITSFANFLDAWKWHLYAVIYFKNTLAWVHPPPPST